MRRSARLQAGAAFVTSAAMVATPLRPRGGRVRRMLTPVIVGGLATMTAASTQRRWGGARATLVAVTATISTAVIERVGHRTGRPFGRYRYTAALRPQWGGVPVVVPLAWFAMATPAREVSHAALGDRSTPLTRIAGGAAALTAWDLFLDPQMVGEGYWRWARTGAYRGIPGTNFVGWFTVSLGVMALLEILLPPDEPAADLVAQYGAVAALETVGFAAFFRDRVVAIVGGLGMLPVVAAAMARLMLRRWTRHQVY